MWEIMEPYSDQISAITTITVVAIVTLLVCTCRRRRKLVKNESESGAKLIYTNGKDEYNQSYAKSDRGPRTDSNRRSSTSSVSSNSGRRKKRKKSKGNTTELSTEPEIKNELNLSKDNYIGLEEPSVNSIKGNNKLNENKSVVNKKQRNTQDRLDENESIEVEPNRTDYCNINKSTSDEQYSKQFLEDHSREISFSERDKEIIRNSTETSQDEITTDTVQINLNTHNSSPVVCNTEPTTYLKSCQTEKSVYNNHSRLKESDTDEFGSSEQTDRESENEDTLNTSDSIMASKASSASKKYNTKGSSAPDSVESRNTTKGRKTVAQSSAEQKKARTKSEKSSNPTSESKKTKAVDLSQQKLSMKEVQPENSEGKVFSSSDPKDDIKTEVQTETGTKVFKPDISSPGTSDSLKSRPDHLPISGAKKAPKAKKKVPDACRKEDEKTDGKERTLVAKTTKSGMTDKKDASPDQGFFSATQSSDDDLQGSGKLPKNTKSPPNSQQNTKPNLKVSTESGPQVSTKLNSLTDRKQQGKAKPTISGSDTSSFDINVAASRKSQDAPKLSTKDTQKVPHKDNWSLNPEIKEAVLPPSSKKVKGNTNGFQKSVPRKELENIDMQVSTPAGVAKPKNQPTNNITYNPKKETEGAMADKTNSKHTLSTVDKVSKPTKQQPQIKEETPEVVKHPRDTISQEAKNGYKNKDNRNVNTSNRDEPLEQDREHEIRGITKPEKTDNSVRVASPDEKTKTESKTTKGKKKKGSHQNSQDTSDAHNTNSTHSVDKDTDTEKGLISPEKDCVMQSEKYIQKQAIPEMETTPPVGGTETNAFPSPSLRKSHGHTDVHKNQEANDSTSPALNYNINTTPFKAETSTDLQKNSSKSKKKRKGNKKLSLSSFLSEEPPGNKPAPLIQGDNSDSKKFTTEENSSSSLQESVPFPETQLSETSRKEEEFNDGKKKSRDKKKANEAEQELAPIDTEAKHLSNKSFTNGIIPLDLVNVAPLTDQNSFTMFPDNNANDSNKQNDNLAAQIDAKGYELPSELGTNDRNVRDPVCSDRKSDEDKIPSLSHAAKQPTKSNVRNSNSPITVQHEPRHVSFNTPLATTHSLTLESENESPIDLATVVESPDEDEDEQEEQRFNDSKDLEEGKVGSSERAHHDTKIQNHPLFPNQVSCNVNADMPEKQDNYPNKNSSLSECDRLVEAPQYKKQNNALSLGPSIAKSEEDTAKKQPHGATYPEHGVDEPDSDADAITDEDISFYLLAEELSESPTNSQVKDRANIQDVCPETEPVNDFLNSENLEKQVPRIVKPVNRDTKTVAQSSKLVGDSKPGTQNHSPKPSFRRQEDLPEKKTGRKPGLDESRLDIAQPKLKQSDSQKNNPASIKEVAATKVNDVKITNRVRSPLTIRRTENVPTSPTKKTAKSDSSSPVPNSPTRTWPTSYKASNPVSNQVPAGSYIHNPEEKPKRSQTPNKEQSAKPAYIIGREPQLPPRSERRKEIPNSTPEKNVPPCSPTKKVNSLSEIDSKIKDKKESPSSDYRPDQFSAAENVGSPTLARSVSSKVSPAERLKCDQSPVKEPVQKINQSPRISRKAGKQNPDAEASNDAKTKYSDLTTTPKLGTSSPSNSRRDKKPMTNQSLNSSPNRSRKFSPDSVSVKRPTWGVSKPRQTFSPSKSPSSPIIRRAKAQPTSIPPESPKDENTPDTTVEPLKNSDLLQNTSLQSVSLALQILKSQGLSLPKDSRNRYSYPQSSKPVLERGTAISPYIDPLPRESETPIQSARKTLERLDSNRMYSLTPQVEEPPKPLMSKYVPRKSITQNTPQVEEPPKPLLSPRKLIPRNAMSLSDAPLAIDDPKESAADSSDKGSEDALPKTTYLSTPGEASLARSVNSTPVVRGYVDVSPISSPLLISDLKISPGSPRRRFQPPDNQNPNTPQNTDSPKTKNPELVTKSTEKDEDLGNETKSSDHTTAVPSTQLPEHETKSTDHTKPQLPEQDKTASVTKLPQVKKSKSILKMRNPFKKKKSSDEEGDKRSSSFADGAESDASISTLDSTQSEKVKKSTLKRLFGKKAKEQKSTPDITKSESNIFADVDATPKPKRRFFSKKRSKEAPKVKEEDKTTPIVKKSRFPFRRKKDKSVKSDEKKEINNESVDDSQDSTPNMEDNRRKNPARDSMISATESSGTDDDFPSFVKLSGHLEGGDLGRLSKAVTEDHADNVSDQTIVGTDDQKVNTFRSIMMRAAWKDKYKSDLACFCINTDGSRWGYYAVVNRGAWPKEVRLGKCSYLSVSLQNPEVQSNYFESLVPSIVKRKATRKCKSRAKHLWRHLTEHLETRQIGVLVLSSEDDNRWGVSFPKSGVGYATEYDDFLYFAWML